MIHKSIFVQIASYRDPDLNNTLESLYSNAMFPERLRVCVANQYAEGDTPVNEYPGLEVINVPYQEVFSACWARNLIQQEYKDEDYTLQLDSHMRLVEGWDVLLIEWYEGLKDKGFNPLITGYLPAFDPLNDPEGRMKLPCIMHFDFFAVDGWVSFRPTNLDNFQKYHEPIPARFYSAHFAFADGAFSKNVQHDPKFYFHGEEISIGVRAYTHGYDLFHPHRVIGWHEYSRKLRIGNKRLQWDNDPSWGQKNRDTFHRMRVLLNMEEDPQIDFGTYGLGTARTLEDFEKYAGLQFKTWKVHPDALNRLPPGLNNESPQEWESNLKYLFKHTIDIHRREVDLTIDDYSVIVVAYHSANNETLFRQDITNPEEIKSLVEGLRSAKDEVQSIEEQVLSQMNKEKDKGSLNWKDYNKILPLLKNIKRRSEKNSKEWANITREFYPTERPKFWVVWFFSKSKGWGSRIRKELPV